MRAITSYISNHQFRYTLYIESSLPSRRTPECKQLENPLIDIEILLLLSTLGGLGSSPGTSGFFGRRGKPGKVLPSFGLNWARKHEQHLPIVHPCVNSEQTTWKKKVVLEPVPQVRRSVLQKKRKCRISFGLGYSLFGNRGLGQGRCLRWTIRVHVFEESRPFRIGFYFAGTINGLD